MERIVIIPALNPDRCLRDIVDRNWELENQVILVDDGSDESYYQFFWELSEKCIVLHHDKNRGKGEAVKTALQYIKEELWECSVIGIMDADGQHLADDIINKSFWQSKGACIRMQDNGLYCAMEV